MASKAEQDGNEHLGGYQDKFWIPRFWSGMSSIALLRLLARNRFRVHLARVPMLLVLLFTTSLSTWWGWLQLLFYGRRIARTEIREAPIFILGHWRSGTTLLHEMLILDRRFAFPDTYACFNPGHFLMTGWWWRPCLSLLLPKVRCMDNMALGCRSPQEDEFALCNMGLPSPYLSLMFPGRPPVDQQYLDMAGVAAADRERWKRGLLWFLKCLTLAHGKRLVLKSPPHTSRIRTLLELFPDARFIHIHRDPQVVFPSTVNLLKRLARDQGLQRPEHDGVADLVFDNFERMYAAFERDRSLVAPTRICDVSYDALVADPVGQMRRIYESLNLGGFDEVLPALEKYLAGCADYRTNRYQVSPEQRAEIDRRWGPLMRKYGYAREEALAD